MAFNHIRDDISSKQSINQSGKKTDFTVDLISASYGYCSLVLPDRFFLFVFAVAEKCLVT